MMFLWQERKQVKMLLVKAFVSWFLAFFVLLSAAFVLYECRQPEMMPGAHLPNPYVLNDPKFSGMRGPTPEEVASEMNGPDYDVSQSVEMP